MKKAHIKKKSVRKSARKVPQRSKDVLVTKGMLSETRAELKSDITALKLDMNSHFKKVEARFDKLESKIEDLTAAVHQSRALSEEQKL